MAIKTFKDYPNTTTPILAEDLNEISNSVLTGWNSANETWEFVSATNPVGIIKVNADVTTKYSEGMKIKMINNSNTIFGKLLEVGAYGSTEAGYTYLTFLHEINPINSLAKNLMVSGLITNNYYSTMHTPYGFPSSDDKWTLIVTQTTRVTTNTPSVGVLYDTGISLKIPKGKWLISVHCGIKEEVSSTNTSPFLYLTSNRSETYATATERDLLTLEAISGVTLYMPTLDIICIPRTITTDKTYYLTYGVNNYDTTYIQTTGDTTTTIIKAVYAY